MNEADGIIKKIGELCKEFGAAEVILFGSRAKGTELERSDIDIAVTGVKDFNALLIEIENLMTLYSIDLVNIETCKNKTLLEEIRRYGRKI